MDLEHPDITYARKTGYPRWKEQDYHCEYCNSLIKDTNDIYSDTHYDYLCKECLLLLHNRWW